MPTVWMSSIKPNPYGKDRASGEVPNRILAAEWIDIKNISNTSVSLTGVTLQHIIYPQNRWDSVMDLTGIDLGVGQILRVHSGGKVDLGLLNLEDRNGADWHCFTGKWYVWNNTGDTARLILPSENLQLDIGSYRGPVREGVVLRRSGQNFI